MIDQVRDVENLNHRGWKLVTEEKEKREEDGRTELESDSRSIPRLRSGSDSSGSYSNLTYKPFLSLFSSCTKTRREKGRTNSILRKDGGQHSEK